MKIKELVNFEEIKDVIDIDSDVETLKNKKEIVNSYIISDGLKKNIELIIIIFQSLVISLHLLLEVMVQESPTF